MFRIPLATSSNEVPIDRFWNAVLIYHNRPHLVNRRLTGALTVLFLKVNFNNHGIKRLSEIFTRSAILYEVRNLKEISKNSITEDFVKNILETYDKNVAVEQSNVNDFKESEDDVYVSVRILLPRQRLGERCVEVAILDKKNKVATFFAVAEFDKKTLAPPFPYDIEHVTDGNLRICLLDLENVESASAEWLADQLFTKLMKWVENFDVDREIQESLSLIPIEAYTELYHNLKNKYGKKVVEAWTENTDPSKFVYEDVAIAAYLISLWQKTDHNKKPSFVDLGCGNGLLVYILNEEGFPGLGIDVRKRKIWDWYPQTVTLKVETITPSADFLFPETDWIIGNHSDELTPWIPIIAARSSFKTNFFLLPCCCYEFSGKKYQRVNTSISVYTEYLMYIRGICNKCGFVTELDKLRIPSTRRTCIVSFGRDYQPDEFQKADDNIKDLIIKRCKLNEATLNSSTWTSDFQARPVVEKIRNCTKLDRGVVMRIINKIFRSLLDENNSVAKADGGLWNKGKTIPLPGLVDIIGKEDLKELKNEYGGLQTLIKNHRYIFEVVNGATRLRVPSTLAETGGRYKSKPCWFYGNHPNGCLHNSEVCAYEHL